MVIKCPNCDGALEYDITSGLLVCKFCKVQRRFFYVCNSLADVTNCLGSLLDLICLLGSTGSDLLNCGRNVFRCLGNQHKIKQI